MDQRRLEQIFLVILTLMFLIGAMLLYKKHARPFKKIIIEKGNIAPLMEIKEQIDINRRININNAVLDEISEIPGIGKVLAGRIVEYRNMHGNIGNKKEMLKIKGIGEKKLNDIAKHMTF